MNPYVEVFTLPGIARFNPLYWLMIEAPDMDLAILAQLN